MTLVADVVVRPCRREETGEVLALWATARSLPPSVPDDEAAVSGRLEHDQSCLLVAKQAGRIVGSLVSTWDGWRGSMYRLAVAPEHRRRGIARQLVTAGEDYLRAQGARRIGALVAREHAPAVALWVKVGYRDDAHIAWFARNL